MEAAMRILYLEDDPAGVDLVASQLTRDGINAQITPCATQEDFIAALAQNYAVFLASYESPGLDLLDFIKIVKVKRSIVPFIVISDSQDVESAVECLKAGADVQRRGEVIGRGPIIKNKIFSSRRRHTR